MSVTLMTSISLCSCLVICSMIVSVAAGDHGQAGDLRVEGLGHAETLDVEAAAAEKSGDPGKDARFVVQKTERVCFICMILFVDSSR